MTNLIRNCWYVAGWSWEFSDKPEARMIVGDPIVLFRTSKGKIAALEDRCVHRMAPLSLGRVEGDSIRCMYHGLKFDAGGQCTEIPGQDLIPKQACVRQYPVVEKSNWIWVWMGDPERADPARIADSKALDDPEWVLKTGQLEYDANYELINDNLLDLTHLAYVHANSFGADEAWSLNRPNLEVLPDGVRSSRWIRNTPPTPPLGEAAEHEKVDIWTSYDFILPGVFLLYTAIFEKGTAEACHDEEPDPNRRVLFSNFTSQAVTAVSERKTRYYYSWGPHSSQGDAEMAQAMIDVARQAFNEDKVMIEAQQKVIDTNTDVRPMPTSADKSITIFQRLMRKQDEPQDAEGDLESAAS
ncbi:aromatic ring-hydroxylating dioxygenase subunit alpha [Parasphingopyxis marina]|uniref:Aromatic ring-hydroxylating dioxygenase subunit alpha n=1 Tax=Parasphingopyxis marina TaxID=2761622 RepID=A0A842I1Z4_9SPHN|nr:aromatic ring-hydroxylating dioxygenase subunit alpha [Parasphingopyxis marina]MBC2778957.1 aromatic ring-hydroxylating dioxygenase subunit alpha [Parasphingopyxis marina]